MKLKIFNYEVEIKARDTFVSDSKEMNENDTMAFLCHIANWAWFSAELHEQNGYEATAEVDKESARNIHDALDEAGYYSFTE